MTEPLAAILRREIGRAPQDRAVHYCGLTFIEMALDSRGNLLNTYGVERFLREAEQHAPSIDGFLHAFTRKLTDLIEHPEMHLAHHTNSTITSMVAANFREYSKGTAGYFLRKMATRYLLDPDAASWQHATIEYIGTHIYEAITQGAVDDNIDLFRDIVSSAFKRERI